jgi:small subunit ribosomal protein S2
MDKEIARLKKKISGIIEMKKLPSALVIVDPKKEETAVAEAKRLSIPVVALLDTNCNPDNIEYPIPGNDDAIRAIKLVVSIIADNIMAVRKKQAVVKAAKKEEEQDAGEKEVSSEPVSEVEQRIIEEIEQKVEAKEPDEPLIRKKPKIDDERKR